jgi:Ser/Thr protein kinase RdoA (MazF antagonist)
MNSATVFYELTPSRILRAVESYGFTCTGRILQLNSLENRVYEVEIECENPSSRFDNFKVIKFYRPGRWNDAQLEEEHQFLLELERELVKVAVPLQDKEGLYCVKEPDTGIRFALFPKIGGRLMDELDEKRLENLGHTIARLHTIGTLAPIKNRLTLNADTFGRDSLDILEAKKSVPEIMEQRYFDVAEEICCVADEKMRGMPLQRLHGDLHVGNILWIDETPLLVDFDDVVRGPVVQDLWLIAPGRDEESIENREILISAYEELRSFDRSQLDLVEYLRALRMIRFSAWIEERWEDPIFEKAFPRFRSMEYWKEQLISLEEILTVQNGSVTSS